MEQFAKWMGCFWLAFVSAIWSDGMANSLPALPLQPQNPSGGHRFPSTIATFQIRIANDPADLYLPIAPDARTRAIPLPIALMLPGALVNRSYYSQFAQIVARHGFAVVVPTHERSVPEVKLSGEIAEASQITATLEFFKKENTNPKSFLYQKLNLSQMALLGHSHGGFVGLQAIANSCIPPFCYPPFSRPDAVAVGVFYGVNSRNPATGQYSPTPNDKIPVALVQGSLDGIATPQKAIATFDLIQTPPKALMMIKGSNHYGITNVNNPSGAMPDKSSPTLTQAQSVEAIAQWTAFFLRAHLYQDPVAYQQVYGNDSKNPLVTITSVAK